MDRRLRTAFLGLAMAQSACSAARPTKLQDWTACLIEGKDLGDLGNADPMIAGEGSVLFLYARWGASAFVSEYQGAEMFLALPKAASLERHYGLETLRGRYSEGSQAVSFRSTHFQGTVEVLRVREHGVDLQVQGTVVEPNVDHGGLRQLPLQGQVKARRVGALVDCI